MPDFSDLTQFRYTGSTENDQPGNNVEAVRRENAADFLRHYCRLSEKLAKTGTIPVLQSLLELEPDDGELHYLLARQYELEKMLPEALVEFERAANLRLDRPTYMLAATRIACLLGDGAKGLALASSVIMAYPIMVEAYYERGLIYEVDENWDRALSDYLRCRSLEPGNPAYLVAAASMYRNKQLHNAARQCLKQAIKIDPSYEPAILEMRKLPFFDGLTSLFRSRSDEAGLNPTFGNSADLSSNFF